MPTTIKEVALKAGVSIATVSRALNNVGPVDERTRQHVRDVARELRYVPNATGRSLSRRKTEAIGLLLPDLFGEFFSEVLRGSDQTAQHSNYHLVVSSSHNNRRQIRAALTMMRGRVDALVIMSPHIDAETLNENLPQSLPVVLLNYQLRVHSIRFDHRRQLRRCACDDDASARAWTSAHRDHHRDPGEHGRGRTIARVSAALGDTRHCRG